MYRISITTIESFRRYMAEASSFDTEEKLLESIKGIFVGNPKTEFGSAYHCILEGKAMRGRGGIILAKGYTFTEAQAAPAIRYRNAHTDIVSEVQVRKIYDTNYFPIQLSGRVDSLEGIRIRDSKTKFRSIDWQEYQNSCQWKFYCDMLDADEFYYDVFEIKRFPEDASMDMKMFPDVAVMESESYQCVRYVGMHKELMALLNEFIEYISFRNLWPYLKPAITNESILD